MNLVSKSELLACMSGPLIGSTDVYQTSTAICEMLDQVLHILQSPD